MTVRPNLVLRWRSLICLAIAAGMLLWGKHLDPRSFAWLSGLYECYWLLCAIASFASIALALIDSIAVWRSVQQERTRVIRRAHQEFSMRFQGRAERPHGDS